jgi:hypothetical protein
MTNQSCSCREPSLLGEVSVLLIFRFDGDGLIVHEEQYYDMFRAATTRLLTGLVTRDRACLIPSYRLIRVLDQPRRSSAERWVSKSPVTQPLPT